MNKQDKTSFNPSRFEPKWQSIWESDKIFAPDLAQAKKPYMNLMMFPYPSAEGLHVGNMYAQTGADVFGRFKRMQGFDVYVPMGLDGFGIHSENYALKMSVHPMKQAKITEARFYKQMKAVGTSVDWSRTLETYDPLYYRWTQWLFTQLFKAGLAYRKKAEVNWCPSCKTVLSDEQVIDGKCERCGTEVEKRELEQWFFRITSYAERLLNNIEGLDWTEKVKVAQKNWIGKKTGVVINFPINEKYRFINLHGFTGTPEKNFFPWLKNELEKYNHTVETPLLPDTDSGNVGKQVQYVIDNYSFDENTIFLGHSLGSVVALKVLERLDKPIKRLVLAAGFAEPGFLDKIRPFEKTTDWKFDFEKIKKNAGEVILLRAENDTAVPQERSNFIQQKIGGTIIDFKAQEDHMCGEQEPEILKNITPSIKVFTTRPDTLYGATFLVVAPEHPFAQEIENAEVKDYIKLAKSKSNIERTSEDKEKTGVFSGTYAVNPVNGEKIPVWIADYVLMGYGTGAIMAVPAHDSRDYEFAKKYKLPIIEVIKGKDGSIKDEAYAGEGELIHSGDWNGLRMPEQLDRVVISLEKNNIGEKMATYHLRDWLISRQRYWGPPIPMIFCQACAANGKGEQKDMVGWYAVSDSGLPVLLPDVEDWRPKGTPSAGSGQAVNSPLANHPEFYNVSCPKCGQAARRETDVSDTFLDSAWYFLGYICDSITHSASPGQAFRDFSGQAAKPKNSESISRDIKIDQQTGVPWDKNVQKKWLPVKKYIGGAEHSVLHLLYARFISMVLADLKLTDFEEPFTSFFAHGLIVKDGAKMSKSKGNVVVPDAYIEKYGADTLRTYLMFLGPFADGGDFRDSGIEGMNRFIKRIWNMFTVHRSQFTEKPSEENLIIMHKTIKKVTEDIEAFKYNTAISAIMEYYNFLSKLEDQPSNIEVQTFLRLLAPFAPYMTEELWQSSLFPSEKLGSSTVHGSQFKSIHLEKWPVWNEKYLVSSEFIIVVQVNGKKRGEFKVSLGNTREEHSSRLTDEEKVKAEAKLLVEKYLEGKEPKKIIYVPGKIVNFVV